MDSDESLIVNPNHCVYSGPFSSKTRTHNGFRVDVCKSCIQKYIRRGNIIKSFYFVYQMYLFKSVQKRVHSNLINRLKCIVSEDIGIADDTGVLQYSEVLDRDCSIKELFHLVVLMCESKKTRMISHINSFYDKRSYNTMRELNPDFFGKKSEMSTYLNSESIETLIKAFSCVGHDSDGKVNIRGIMQILNQKSDLTESHKLLIGRFKKSSQKEKFVYLFHAILLFYRGLPKVVARELSPDEWDVLSSVVEQAKNNSEIEIDDFCLDKHVRGNTKTSKDFALEGAYVENEDMHFRIPILYENYLQVKCNTGKPPPNSFQAQLLTSTYKKKVTVFPESVLKGPYSVEGHRLRNNQEATEELIQLELTLNLPNSMKASLPIKAVKREDDGVYIEWDNVGIFHNAVVSECSSKLESKVPIAKRGSFVKRVSELLQKKTVQQIEADERLKQITIASLQHLYHRSVLGIKDNCLENMLVIEKRTERIPAEQVIVGIDLEERTQNKEKTNIFKKRTKLSEMLLNAYGSYLRKLEH